MPARKTSSCLAIYIFWIYTENAKKSRGFPCPFRDFDWKKAYVSADLGANPKYNIRHCAVSLPNNELHAKLWEINYMFGWEKKTWRCWSINFSRVCLSREKQLISMTGTCGKKTLNSFRRKKIYSFPKTSFHLIFTCESIIIMSFLLIFSYFRLFNSLYCDIFFALESSENWILVKKQRLFMSLLIFLLLLSSHAGKRICHDCGFYVIHSAVVSVFMNLSSIFFYSQKWTSKWFFMSHTRDDHEERFSNFFLGKRVSLTHQYFCFSWTRLFNATA